MAFMQPQITDKQDWYKGEAKDGGTYCAPAAYFGRHTFAVQVLGYSNLDEVTQEIVDGIERITGWGVRLSAPGYMDCTDWEVFTSHDDALERYAELRAEDDDSEGDD